METCVYVLWKSFLPFLWRGWFRHHRCLFYTERADRIATLVVHRRDIILTDLPLQLSTLKFSARTHLEYTAEVQFSWLKIGTFATRRINYCGHCSALICDTCIWHTHTHTHTHTYSLHSKYTNALSTGNGNSDWPIPGFTVVVQWYVFGAIFTACITDDTAQSQHTISHCYCKSENISSIFPLQMLV